MTIEDRSSKTTTWSTWAGSLDRLRSLTETADELIDDKRDDELREARSEVESRIEDELNHRTALFELLQGPEKEAENPIKNLERERVQSRFAYMVDRVEERWTTHLRVVDSDLSRTRSGPWLEVLEKIDPNFVQRLEISAPNRSSTEAQIEISMSKAGCRLEVQGAEPHWVRGASGLLEAEINKSVPWWHHLREQTVFVLIAPIIVYFLNWVILIARGLLLPWDETLVANALVAVVFGLPAALGARAVARRVLPGFHIVTPQTSGRTSRALVFIGGVFVLPLLLGVLLELIFAD